MIYEVSEKGYTNILKKKSKHRNTGTKKEQTSFQSALLKKVFIWEFISLSSCSC
jgi:hypothetical protein